METLGHFRNVAVYTMNERVKTDGRQHRGAVMAPAKDKEGISRHAKLRKPRLKHC